MKTSKIILIAFLSVFCLSLLSFLITVDGKHYSNKTKDLETKTENLSNFSIIKVVDGANVRIKTSNANKLSYSYSKEPANSSIYQIIGDTLLLKPLKLDNYIGEYTVELTKIKEIINKGGSLRVDLMQDSISINNQNKGRCYINRKSTVTNIQLNSIAKSNTTISSDNIQQLIMNIDNADVTVNRDIHSVNLTANNNSRVTLQSVKSLVAECDPTSEFNVY
jgi:hypothetical protein